MTTQREVQRTLARHRGRRGIGLLNALTCRYAEIPYARTRSNAEARALEVLHDAGAPRPRVNVRVAGEEADLVFDGLIVEIDGPQFHRFPDEDARKAQRWRAAGYTVRRIPSGAVFDDPARLLALVAHQ